LIRIARLIAAIWFGASVFLLFVAAPAAFISAPSATVAADVVGAMLLRWHYIALLAPLLILGLGWRNLRGWIIAILFAAVLCASAQAIIDTRIRGMRAASVVPISSLPREDPLRRRFGQLHGASSLLLVAQMLTAGAVASATDP
jgi:hypothetical protein